jgi:hypothetical protein
MSCKFEKICDIIDKTSIFELLIKNKITWINEYIKFKNLNTKIYNELGRAEFITKMFSIDVEYDGLLYNVKKAYCDIEEITSIINKLQSKNIYIYSGDNFNKNEIIILNKMLNTFDKCEYIELLINYNSTINGNILNLSNLSNSIKHIKVKLNFEYPKLDFTCYFNLHNLNNKINKIEISFVNFANFKCNYLTNSLTYFCSFVENYRKNKQIFKTSKYINLPNSIICFEFNNFNARIPYHTQYVNVNNSKLIKNNVINNIKILSLKHHKKQLKIKHLKILYIYDKFTKIFEYYSETIILNIIEDIPCVINNTTKNIIIWQHSQCTISFPDKLNLLIIQSFESPDCDIQVNNYPKFINFLEIINGSHKFIKEILSHSTINILSCKNSTYKINFNKIKCNVFNNNNREIYYKNESNETSMIKYNIDFMKNKIDNLFNEI